ncbi:MAG: hypothetical protein ACI9R3_001696 [Verrucomicrobiales bacterium]|jgi:hypothetical protein
MKASPLLISALLIASASISSAQLEELWRIGEDDSSQADFVVEGEGDDFFYLEDGDYTGLDPAGEVWTDGPEEWSTFERAFNANDNDINIYFQLDPEQADPSSTFQFDIEFIQAEAGSIHDMEMRMNGTTFRTELGVIADGANEVLVTETFLGIEVGAQEGPNVLTIERTGGSGAWIQMDYLTLQVDASTGGCEDAICNFIVSADTTAPGGTVELRWIVNPDATLSIEPGIGNVDADTSSGIGFKEIAPVANTTYTLTSMLDGETVTTDVTVNVTNITSFQANPNQVLPNAVSVLSWSVDPTASVSIDQGIGSVDAQTTDGVGSIDVNPAETTTYIITSTRGEDVETALVNVVVNNFTRLWLIGNDNGNASEFEHENDGDEFFYIDNGDYTGLDPEGSIWDSGPEPWSVIGDPALGFPRALNDANPELSFYFQLDAGQANPGTTFLFNAEFIDAESGSNHDLAFRMNGNEFHSETEVVADGAIEFLVSPTFTGDDVGAVTGSNVLTIERTSGVGAWIQMDYVELKADLSTASCDDPICSFAGSPAAINPSGSSDLVWAVDPTATVSIDNGIGNVDNKTTNGVGTIRVAPTQNTTYTITSTVGESVDTQEILVVVKNIVSFSAVPLISRPNTPVTLSWQVDPSASVSIDQGVGNVDAATVDGIGSIAVSPTQNTVYSLTSTRGADVETTTFTVEYLPITQLWQIGNDDGGQSEFDHEAEADAFFYVEDGDYSETSPDDGVRFGELWDRGPELWRDGTAEDGIGFRRALNDSAFDINIFFQLDAAEANPASIFTFSVEFRAPEATSTHDIDLSMNGVLFHSEAEVDSAAEDVLIKDTFTGEDVGAKEGPNVLTVARTAGTGAWIQMDYVRLEVEPLVGTQFSISNVELVEGGVTLTWPSKEGETYKIEYAPDLNNWEEAEDGLESGGTTTSYTATVPAGTQIRYFRVSEEG